MNPRWKRMAVVIAFACAVPTATTALWRVHDEPAVRPAEQVQVARLMSSLAEIPTRRAARGDAEDQAGLVATEELVIARLRELGLEPRTQQLRYDPRVRPRRPNVEEPPDAPNDAQPEAPADTQPDAPAPIFRNVWVDLPGTDLPGEVIIIGCHLDAVVGSPGADDNGTGIAAVLEMARILHDKPMRRTVRLMFFNLEEVGLIGSTVYARSIKPDVDAGKEKIIGMAAVDMLGFFSDEPDSQRSPLRPVPGVFDPPTVADFIGIAGIAKHREFSQRLNREMLAASPGLKTVVADFLPVALPVILRSDHAPFLIWLDAPAVIISDTAEFRSPHYHRATDTIDTIDAERFAGVVKGLTGAVHAIAEPAKEP